MLFGYKEVLDNRLATMVTAADTVAEYENWTGQFDSEHPCYNPDPKLHVNFEEFYVSQFLDPLTRDEFKGYKMPVFAFYHTDEAQRDAFILQFNIKEVKPLQGRDRMEDMIFLASQEQEALLKEADPALANRTLEEIHGLDKHDPWDRRTDAEREADKEMKEKIKQLQKDGKMSGDSFAPNQGKKNDVFVTDIRSSTGADGKITIDNVLAVKRGGEVDEEAKAKIDEQNAIEADHVFSPEDFAAVLAGNGALHSVSSGVVDGERPEVQHGTPVARPSLSEHAEEQRRKHQEEEERKRLEKEIAEEKADRDQGVFRSTDIAPRETKALGELAEDVQTRLKELGVAEEAVILVSRYPVNATVGNVRLLPNNTTEDEAPQLQEVMGGKVRGGVWSVGAQVTLVEVDDEEKGATAIYKAGEKVWIVSL